MKNINQKDFHFEMPIPMRWNDMDALGHINNIYYFEYFQIVRGHYMMTMSPTWDWDKHMFVIAHIACDYYREIKLTTPNVRIKIRTAALSNKSFDMEYLIVSDGKDGSDMIHAKGKSVQVMIDMKEKKSIAIPDWLRNDMINFEPALD
ncbi:MAG: acyl-CoA thioesterase [Weeksellaceae bacterium]